MGNSILLFMEGHFVVPDFFNKKEIHLIANSLYNAQYLEHSKSQRDEIFVENAPPDDFMSRDNSHSKAC